MARYAPTSNAGAFLDMIAWSELGAKLLAASDDGYNVLVGGTLFDSYADHPRRLVQIRNGLSSTAAGRYQLLSRYFDHYRTLLNLTDFGPEAQDRIALQQIKECRAIELVNDGEVEVAVARCRNIWASLPGADYGQHENKITDLVAAYQQAGGSIA